jgi:next to BRCA1 gene 1 protein
MESGSAEVHNPFHEFFDIEEPGRVIVHTVLSGSGERDATPTTRGNDRPSQSTTTADSPGQEQVTHNAYCDLCDSRITGERYVSFFCMCH